MAANNEVLIPTYGADFAPGTALPAPERVADSEIVVALSPLQESRVEIFTSADPRLGSTVETYAQELHTDVYLERDYITEADLNEFGVFVDEYSNRSTSLYVRNGSKVAAARYVHADKKEGGILSLPTTKNFDIDAEVLRQAAGVRRLSELKPKEIIEVSGLVARKQQGVQESNADATKALYARILRDSLEQGHKVWVQNVSKGFLRYLSGMVGQEQVHVLGPEKQYMGPATVPVALNPQEVVRAILEGRGGTETSRAYLKEVLQGVDDRKIPAGLRKLLKEQDIQTTEYADWKRLLINPKTFAYSAIMAYSASRAIPAASVEEFDGSMALLWGIDVATAVPYTWGAIEMFAGKTATRRAIGATVAAGTFAAPYVYFEMAGNDYPGYVNAAIGAFVGITVVKEVVTQLLTRNKERNLTAGLLKSNQDTAKTAQTALPSPRPELA